MCLVNARHPDGRPDPHNRSFTTGTVTPERQIGHGMYSPIVYGSDVTSAAKEYEAASATGLSSPSQAGRPAGLAPGAVASPGMVPPTFGSVSAAKQAQANADASKIIK